MERAFHELNWWRGALGAKTTAADAPSSGEVRKDAAAKSQTLFSACLVALTGLVILGALAFITRAASDIWGLVVVGPTLIALSLPVLRREAVRQGDKRLFWLLLLALLLKLFGAILRHHVAFDIYGGVADAKGYHGAGRRLAASFASGDFDLDRFLPATGTNFISILTGAVYTIIGPTLLGGFLFYSWLSFWGLFLFYKAFTLAVPEGRSATYARLLFFLPSMFFWPSSIGKEAWMVLALGIGAYGVAQVLSGATWQGLSVTAAGLVWVAMVRPHVAGMMAVALAAGYMLRRPHRELRQVAIVVKTFSLALLVAVAGVMVLRAESFLHGSRIYTRNGAVSTLDRIAERTGQGGSQFAAPSVLKSPAQVPVAAVTVLFRPFPFEAHNAQALAAAAEGAFLLLFSLVRIRWIFAAVGSARRRPYVAFAIAFTAVFIIAFSAIGNFGILTRQRVQVLPLYLVLLAIPPMKTTEPVRGTP